MLVFLKSDENFNKVGEFSTSGEAADHYNITRSPIKNNINKKFTRCIVNGLPVLILFCRNTLLKRLFLLWWSIRKQIMLILILALQKLNELLIWEVLLTLVRLKLSIL